MGHKNGKGTVRVTEFNGRMRLRWRYAGKRYSLNLVAFSELNLLQARKVVLQIEQDLILGSFDHTLLKYNGKQANKPAKTKSFTDYFEYWVKNY